MTEEPRGAAGAPPPPPHAAQSPTPRTPHDAGGSSSALDQRQPRGPDTVASAAAAASRASPRGGGGAEASAASSSAAGAAASYSSRPEHERRGQLLRRGGPFAGSGASGLATGHAGAGWGGSGSAAAHEPEPSFAAASPFATADVAGLPPPVGAPELAPELCVDLGAARRPPPVTAGGGAWRARASGPAADVPGRGGSCADLAPPPPSAPPVGWAVAGVRQAGGGRLGRSHSAAGGGLGGRSRGPQPTPSGSPSTPLPLSSMASGSPSEPLFPQLLPEVQVRPAAFGWRRMSCSRRGDRTPARQHPRRVQLRLCACLSPLPWASCLNRPTAQPPMRRGARRRQMRRRWWGWSWRPCTPACPASCCARP